MKTDTLVDDKFVRWRWVEFEKHVVIVTGDEAVRDDVMRGQSSIGETPRRSVHMHAVYCQF